VTVSALVKCVALIRDGEDSFSALSAVGIVSVVSVSFSAVSVSVSAVNVAWPITDKDFGIRVEQETIRANLVIELNSVGALEEFVALAGDGIDSVWAEIGLVMAIDVGGRLAAGSLRGEKKGFGAILVFVAVAIGTLIEGVALARNGVDSVFTRFWCGLSGTGLVWGAFSATFDDFSTRFAAFEITLGGAHFWFFAIDILGPVAHVDLGVEEESVGAELFVPPDPVRTLVKGVAHTGHRVNTVFAEFIFVVALNVGWGFATLRFLRKQKARWALLWLGLDAIGAVVELAAIFGIPEDSVFGTDAWRFGGKVDAGEETLFNAGQSSVPILATREVATVLFSVFSTGAANVFWPITDVDRGVEVESVGAELFVPPNTVGARVERVTHTGHWVNTVFAIFRLVRAFNLGGMLALFGFFWEKKWLGTFLVLKSVAERALVEFVAFLRVTKYSVSFGAFVSGLVVSKACFETDRFWAVVFATVAVALVIAAGGWLWFFGWFCSWFLGRFFSWFWFFGRFGRGFHGAADVLGPVAVALSLVEV
jgi:hypothetical protein